jgi:uncharacterized protein (TIGR03435 family)
MKIIGKSATTGNPAVVLSYILGRPVRDQTGLTEDYAFKLEWAEEFDAVRIAKGKGLPAPAEAHPPDAPTADPAGPSLYSAIERQLGLKLEATKGPVEIIVIDRAERPSAN